MMQDYKIRTKRTDSVNSNDSNKIIGVQLNSTSKLTNTLDVYDTLDVYERFNKERLTSNRFRLIFTINPFCSNVLFNAITEVTKDEGSENVIVVDDNVDTTQDLSKNKHVVGNPSPERWEMVMNTEYSKPEIGYEYKPGFDIFTNHILRKKTFKMVNYLTNKSVKGDVKGQTDFINNNDTQSNRKSYNFSDYSSARYVYNTIADFMRYDNGDCITYNKRLRMPRNNNDIKDGNLIKHLYDYENILNYLDSINDNLSEENGWFGFVNDSSIETKSMRYRSNESVKSIPTNNNMVINDKEGCEFIDMYPDRSLFSFYPKYNRFRNREEHNWDTLITYPYKNYYNHELVSDDDFNGMKVLSVEKALSHYGDDIILIRTYVKHGLKKGDTITIYSKTDNGYKNVIRDDDEDTYLHTFTVRSLGDLNSDNQEYFFTVNDMTWLEKVKFIRSPQKNYTNQWGVVDGDTFVQKTDLEITEVLNKSQIRYRKVNRGVESEYYFRQFRKLPNLKKSISELTLDDVIDKEKFEKFLSKNSVDRKNKNSVLDFDKKTYKLAFSRTIFNDSSSQVTYTDDIDLTNLLDNRNRPLTEIYFTIIKRNKGYKEWYCDIDRGSEDVEFSHCFGEINSGIEMFSDEHDNIKTKVDKARLGDISFVNMIARRQTNYAINDSILDNNTTERLFNSKPLEYSIDKYGTKLYNSGTEEKDLFLGDIVEYNSRDCVEKRIEWVNHRFNTMQRELSNYDNNKNGFRYSKFAYQEIQNDDYDIDDYAILNYVPVVEESENATNERDVNYRFSWLTEDVMDNTSTNPLWVWQRPEGYYYKPFYPIKVSELGQIQQASDKLIRYKAIKSNDNDKTISVNTYIKHELNVFEQVVLCVNKKNKEIKEYYLRVKEVVSNNGVILEADNDKEFSVISRLLKNNNKNTEIELVVKNKTIPLYADKIGKHSYIWRDILKIGDPLSKDLPEYPFTNGAFYVHDQINFFLKRQDPHNHIGIQCFDCFPNDIAGDVKNEDRYIYKDETFVLC